MERNMVAERRASGRSDGSPKMKRRPASVSATRCSGSRRTGGGSGLRINRTISAENRKETASNRIAIGAVMSCTRTPVSPGPAISAIEMLSASLLLPSRIWSRATSAGRYDW